MSEQRTAATLWNAGDPNGGSGRGSEEETKNAYETRNKVINHGKIQDIYDHVNGDSVVRPQHNTSGVHTTTATRYAIPRTDDVRFRNVVDDDDENNDSDGRRDTESFFFVDDVKVDVVEDEVDDDDDDDEVGEVDEEKGREILERRRHREELKRLDNILGEFEQQP